MTTAKETQDKARLEEAKVGALLRNNADARVMMDILRDLFYDGDLLGREPHETYHNLGRREVVRFLMDLRDREEK